MIHMDMHNIKRHPQDVFPTSRIIPGQSATITNTIIATDTAAQSALTSYSQTVVLTIQQPATTLVTTRTDVIPVTDSAIYSSLRASESSASAAQGTGSTAKSSSATAATSTAASASKSSSSNKLNTLIPAIVVPVAAVLIISFVIFWFMMRKRHQRRLKEESQFVMASKPEKNISRGNSNSSGHSSTRELVPMSKLEKEVAVSTSEVKKSSLDMFPPKYSSTDIGLARPMTPPEKANGVAAKERTFANFSSPRPTAPHNSRLSQDRNRANRNRSNSASATRGMPPPQPTGRNAPPNPSRGPPPGAARGPSGQQPRPPRPEDRNRIGATGPPRGGAPPLVTAMNNGTRAPPPKALEPPTPTGAFNGASPISQYSPIVKDHFNLDAVASSGETGDRGLAPLSLTTNIPYTRDTDSPIDHTILSKENMRIARLANSSRLGFNSSPVEPNFPTRSASGAKILSPLAETESKSAPTATSPRLPPPLSREDMPPKLFAQGLDSPAPGSSIYPSPSIGADATPRVGAGFSTPSLPQIDQYSRDVQPSGNGYPRASIISRLSSDDGYVDMDVDAKSDVSSLDEREKWDMESDRPAAGPGAGYSGSGYGSTTLSPVEGPVGTSSAGTGTTKPSMRDRDSEGPFVLSRYQS